MASDRINDAAGQRQRETPLRYGEMRTFSARDRNGDVLKTITVCRTDRPYIYDLCDAYNEARDASSIDRGLEWYIGANGELKLGFDRAHSFRNPDRPGFAPVADTPASTEGDQA